VGVLRERGRDDQQAVDIDGRLAVVALHEAFVAGHDPGFCVGQVDLILGLWPAFRDFWLLAARFFPGFALGFAASHFVGIVLLGLLVAFVNPFGNLGLGCGQGLQALFAASDFSGSVVLGARFLLIGFGRFGQ
jgi:hypothetical protein